MAVVTVKDRARLRLGFEGPRGRTDAFGLDSQAPGRQKGVIIWGEESNKLIPPGALVMARVDRPDAIRSVHADDSQPALPTPAVTGPQGYVFESAPRPPTLTVGGAAQPRGRGRVFHVSPASPGVMLAYQQESVWAPFAPSATESLVVLGKGRHAISMPGQTGATPDLALADTHLLRLRWTGTVETGETLYTLLGGETQISGKWASAGAGNDTNLVPGSIVITLPGAYTVRDTGDGRLVGVGGGGERFDGAVNYVTGDWVLNIGGVVIALGAVTVDYEHSCLYAPLDVEVEWDALMAM